MTLQNRIDAMYNGDKATIIESVNSSVDILVMNAIISGTRAKIKDNDFLVGVSKAKENRTILMGIPIGSVAEAALCYLKETKYMGDDEIVKNLIRSGFAI